MKRRFLTISLAILFSIILWLSISLSSEYFTGIVMPINYVDIPKGYIVGAYTSDEVTLSFKSIGWQILALNLSKETAFNVSVKNDSGRQKVNLRESLSNNSWLTNTIQVLDISPIDLDVFVEKIAYKKVKVIPNLSLQFKSNFGLTAPLNLKPDSVLLSGPQSFVEDISTIKTYFKEFIDLNESFSEELKLDLDPILNSTPPFVKINFDIQELVDREFENISVSIVNLPPFREVTFYPDKVNIVLRGGIDYLGKFDKNLIQPYIDYNDVIDDTLGSVPPRLSVPDFTEIIVIKPNRLKYIIKKM